MKQVNFILALRKATLALFMTGSSLITVESVSAQSVYALSGNALYQFDAMNAAAAMPIGEISGITPGQMIEGIDFRPLTGQLYALGYDRNMQTAQLYVVDPATAMATAVNLTPISLVLGPVGAERLEVTFDFNPTVDRIRVMSNRDYNYRLHPVTGAVVFTDLNLQYAVADMNAGANPNVVTGAYTNSYVGATSTTLYDVDAKLRVLAKQDPPNNGTLNTVGMVLDGGLKTLSPADMDIFYNPETQMNEAYLVANRNGVPDKFLSIDLTTGMATLISNVIGDSLFIQDIACFIDRSYPALMGTVGYALNTNNFLLAFDTSNPGIIREAVPVTGITLNQSIVGLDFRPATGELYALGYNTATSESQLYMINPATGVATAVNMTPTILSLGGTQVGVDFNPVVDKIRVISSNNMNYRLNTDGTILFTDLNLQYAAGDMNEGMDPVIGAGAYTNSYAGAATTSLYVHDNMYNAIALQSPPNDGVLSTVGGTGLMQNTADPSTDIDIVYDGVSNWAYFTGNTGTSTFDKLYQVDLATGMTMDMGWIGNGLAVKNIAFPVYNPMREAAAVLAGVGKLKADVFPNPAHNLLTVKTYNTTSAITRIRITNILGKDTGIETEQEIAAGGSVSLDVSPLLPGTYQITIQAEGKMITKSFVKL